VLSPRGGGGEKVLEDGRGNREGHLVAPIR
jgi:hypothetical protein